MPKTIDASATALLGLRSGVDLDLYGVWRFSENEADTTTFSLTGYDSSGAFNRLRYRVRDVRYHNRMPYYHESLTFPSLSVTLDNPQDPCVPNMGNTRLAMFDDCYPSTYPHTGEMTSNSVIGGRMTVKGVVDHAWDVTLFDFSVDRAEYRTDGYGLTVYGYARTQDYNKILIDATLLTTYNPAWSAYLIFQTFATDRWALDACQTSFIDASAILVDETILMATQWEPNTRQNLLTELTKCAWHGIASLWIASTGEMHYTCWRSDPSATADHTLDECSMVLNTVRLVPRYDRIVTSGSILVRNLYQSLTAMSSTGFGGGIFGALDQIKDVQYEYMNRTDTCMTSVSNALTALFDYTLDGNYKIPHTFHCNIPFGLGMLMELNDTVCVTYQPLGIIERLYRIEELGFELRAGAAEWSLVMNDRVIYS